jgi:hypothetical protein
VEKPAYCRIVQGRAAYIVACGPRRKGAKPGSVSAYGSPSRSCAVYSGLTAMPSGVCQFSASRLPPGADFAAACFHSSSETGLNSGWTGLMDVSCRTVGFPAAAPCYLIHNY